MTPNPPTPPVAVDIRTPQMPVMAPMKFTFLALLGLAVLSAQLNARVEAVLPVLPILAIFATTGTTDRTLI
jgi:hypothetical protein